MWSLTQQAFCGSFKLLFSCLPVYVLMEYFFCSHSVSISLPASPSSSSSFSLDGGREDSSLQRLHGEKDMQLVASLVGVEVVMCGGDVGEVMSASVTGEYHYIYDTMPHVHH